MTALQIPALAKMHSNGFDPIVLHEIESNAMMQAIEFRLLKGYASHPSEDVTRFAATLLPQGIGLHKLYDETKAALKSFESQDLARFTEHLERVAGDLEFAGVRILARKGSMESFAVAQQGLGERYADLIDAALAIENAGGPMPIFQYHALKERPDGPLEPFFDKAMAILAQRKQGEHQRPSDHPH